MAKSSKKGSRAKVKKPIKKTTLKKSAPKNKKAVASRSSVKKSSKKAAVRPHKKKTSTSRTVPVRSAKSTPEVIHRAGPVTLPQSEAEKRQLLAKAASLPAIALNDRELCDIEQIIIGGFAPLNGFMTEKEYNGVVNDMRLPDGSVFPIPITLSVKEFKHKLPVEVALTDTFGNPLAIMTVTSVYQPNKEHEAKQVLGSNDPLHPSVKYLASSGTVYLGGPIQAIQAPIHHDFKELRFTPSQLKDLFKKKGIEQVVAFQTRNPIHRAHFELIRRSGEKIGGHVLIHPVVGLTKEGDIDYITRVRAYKKLHQAHASHFATLSLLHLAMRMAGPREALWHAIIRKNYGATHFIVGRDHAGPGNDSAGNPFYGPYDAHNLTQQFENEIGISIITSQEMLYSEERQGYVPADEVKEGEKLGKISGTQFRKMIADDEEVPSWFSFSEVIDEIRTGFKRERDNRGAVVFMTGLSGAGKSTIADILHTKLMEIQNRNITRLDGDVVRRHLSKGLSFSKDDRNTNIERIGYVASEVARHGGIAICAAIAPYRESRSAARTLVNRYGTFVEIFVDTSLAECERRDPKGLYQKTRAGKMTGMTGIDDPYEAPENAEIVIRTEEETAEEAAERIIAFLIEKKLIKPA